MPIPFLFIGIAAATGAIGIGKSIKAKSDNDLAKSYNEDANDIINKATKDAKISRERADKALSNLGKEKISILNGSINTFVKTFEQIHSIELADSVGLNELNSIALDKQSFISLKEMSSTASSIIGGLAGGAAAGALTAIGAYGGAMTLGACATTGTAIATLSGAAATNATLAFLGGGALSVGGLGIAGGTAVLGGLVAGPALAIMGFVVGAKASANKEKAYSNYEKAKEYREQVKTVQILCKAIRERANMFYRLLVKLDAIFSPAVAALSEVIEKSGTDYSKYTQEEKTVVATCLSLAKAIKSVLDTPILTESGELTDDSKKIAVSVQKEIDSKSNA